MSGFNFNLGQDINSMRFISNLGGGWRDELVVPTGKGVPLKVWTHVAFTRAAGTIYIFTNGKLVASGSGFANYNFNTAYNLGIGYFNDGTNVRFLSGYIDEFRLSNVARWTADFTPSVLPYFSYDAIVTKRFTNKLLYGYK